jgi:hypothetical protein
VALPLITGFRASALRHHFSQAGRRCQLSGMQGASFQFGRTSTRLPPHFTLGGVSPIREGSDLSALSGQVQGVA